MHITLPVFQILPKENSNTQNGKNLFDIIDEGCLYDYLEKKFAADYFDLLGINYEDYVKNGDLLKEFCIAENRYEFSKANLKAMRLDFLKNVIGNVASYEDAYDKNTWQAILDKLNYNDNFTYPELIVLDEYGGIYDTGYLPALYLGEDSVILTYIDSIDYHW